MALDSRGEEHLAREHDAECMGVRGATSSRLLGKEPEKLRFDPRLGPRSAC